MVIAGDRHHLLHLGVLPDKQVIHIAGIFRGAQSLGFQNQAMARHAVGAKPLGHLPRLGHLTHISGSGAAGDSDIGPWVLPRRVQSRVQPVYQLLLHGAVGIQGVAEHHNAQGIILRKAIVEGAAGIVRGSVALFPACHNFAPEGALLWVLSFQGVQAVRYLPGSVRLVIGVVSQKIVPVIHRFLCANPKNTAQQAENQGRRKASPAHHRPSRI